MAWSTSGRERAGIVFVFYFVGNNDDDDDDDDENSNAQLNGEELVQALIMYSELEEQLLADEALGTDL